MNNYSSTSNSPGLLKSVYKTGAPKGPISQMNDAHPMIHAIRKKRDLVKLK